MIYKSTYKDFQGEYDVEFAKDVRSFVLGRYKDNDIVIRLHKSCCCDSSANQVIRCPSHGSRCNFYKLEEYDSEYIKYKDYIYNGVGMDCLNKAIIQFSSRYIPKEVQEDITRRMKRLQKQKIFRSYFSVVYCLFAYFLFTMSIAFGWNFYHGLFILLILSAAIFITFYNAN